MRTNELACADLPDLNVWLALAVREHPFHSSAAHWWNTAAAESVMVCRVTALGLVRLLGQPRVMGAGALSVDAALGVYEAFLGLGEVRWLEEPPGVDQLWRSLFRSHQLRYRHGTDAYLASLALSRRLRLVTFDRDFQRFTDLDVLLLSAGEGDHQERPLRGRTAPLPQPASPHSRRTPSRP